MFGTGQQIVELLRERDRIDAQVVSLLRQFDDDCEWADDAAVSLFAWLRDIAGRGRRDAGRLKDLVNKLGRMPAIEEAWLAGELSSGHVDAIAANVDHATGKLFAEHEAELLPTLVELTPMECESAMRVWKARAEAIIGSELPAEQPRALHLSDTSGGYVGRVNLDAEGGEVVSIALALAESDDAEGEPARTPAHRRADSLVDICQFFLDTHEVDHKRRNRPHVNVMINLDDFETATGGTYLSGMPVDTVSMSTLSCDCNLRRILVAEDGELLDFGRETRNVPQRLLTAVAIRDRHCRFPGCDRPPKWCDVHHVHWFSRGGATEIGNLTLLCRRHHRLLHKPGWNAKLLPDATFEGTMPNGLTRTSRPPCQTPRLL